MILRTLKYYGSFIFGIAFFVGLIAKMAGYETAQIFGIGVLVCGTSFLFFFIRENKYKFITDISDLPPETLHFEYPSVSTGTAIFECPFVPNNKNIFITGAFPGIGKSTLSIALANHLQSQNKSVAMIDCDIERKKEPDDLLIDLNKSIKKFSLKSEMPSDTVLSEFDHVIFDNGPKDGAETLKLSGSSNSILHIIPIRKMPLKDISPFLAIPNIVFVLNKSFMGSGYAYYPNYYDAKGN